MSLMDKFYSGVDYLKDIGKTLQRKAVVGAIVGGSVLGGYNAKAGVINIDPSWTWQEIHNVIDGNPDTKGKRTERYPNGYPDAQPGDMVHFAQGTYQQPGTRVSLELKIDNVDLKGVNKVNTFLRGFTPTSGVVIRVYSKGNTISDLDISNTFAAITFEGENFGKNTVTRINGGYSDRIEKFAIWDNIYAEGRNDEPSISFDNNTIKGADIGFNFDKRDVPTNSQSKFIGVTNNSLIQIMDLGMDPPNYKDVNGQRIILGQRHIHGNDFDGGRNGATFSHEIYDGWRSPNWTGEKDLRPGHPYLVDLGVGVGNFKSDDFKRNIYFRPLPGSPLINDEAPGGYIGANTQAGDMSNSDVDVDLEDMAGFQRAFTGESVEAPIEDRFNFDFDSDRDIDLEDWEFMTRAITGPKIRQ